MNLFSMHDYLQIINTSIKLKQMTRQRCLYIKSTMVLCVHDNRSDGHEVLYIYTYIQYTVDVTFQINKKKPIIYLGSIIFFFMPHTF